jgi:hypothetical protein
LEREIDKAKSKNIEIDAFALDTKSTNDATEHSFVAIWEGVEADDPDHAQDLVADYLFIGEDAHKILFGQVNEN